MPAKGKQPRRLHAFDQHVQDQVFVAGIGDVPLYPLADGKHLPLELRTEPVAEFLGVGQRPPNPGARGLEQNLPFDAIGRWRTTESGVPIDSTGSLPDGRTIAGVNGLRELIVGERERFVRTVTEKLLTYALGRGVEYYDMPTVRQITRDAAPTEYRWSSIILNIVKSRPFQMRSRKE